MTGRAFLHHLQLCRPPLPSCFPAVHYKGGLFCADGAQVIISLLSSGQCLMFTLTLVSLRDCVPFASPFLEAKPPPTARARRLQLNEPQSHLRGSILGACEAANIYRAAYRDMIF